MTKARLEAFSDGVIAIIITIMVLELRTPASADWAALGPLMPVFLSYLLSFIYVGIYWNNHHHLFQVTHHVTGGVLWANLNLLFWLSLTPFVTAWMGETGFAAAPVGAYGGVLLLSAIAFTVLTRALVAADGKDSPIARALGDDAKGRISLALYVIAVALSPFARYGSCAIYAIVAMIWLVPDRRMERVVSPRA